MNQIYYIESIFYYRFFQLINACVFWISGQGQEVFVFHMTAGVSAAQARKEAWSRLVFHTAHFNNFLDNNPDKLVIQQDRLVCHTTAQTSLSHSSTYYYFSYSSTD